MIDFDLLEMLACPLDAYAPLEHQDLCVENELIISGTLKCSKCDREYVITDGVPDLFPDAEIEAALGKEELEKWKLALEVFTEWRDKTWSDPAISPIARKSSVSLKEKFFDFAEIQCRMLLDVGGAGGMSRKYLPESISYYCLDPLPITDHIKGFPFVRGVGEFLPFKDGAFEGLTVLESLDHLLSPARFFDEAARVLKVGGRIYVSQNIRGHGLIQKFKTFAEYIAAGQFRKIFETTKLLIVSRNRVSTGETHTQHYSETSLREFLERNFDIIKSQEYSDSVFFVAEKKSLIDGDRQSRMQS